jgi:hypothetical protein
LLAPARAFVSSNAACPAWDHRRHSRGPQEEKPRTAAAAPDSDPSAARPIEHLCRKFCKFRSLASKVPATRVLRIAKDHPDPLMRLFVQRKLHQLSAEDSAAVNWSSLDILLSALRCAKSEWSADAATITARNKSDVRRCFQK